VTEPADDDNNIVTIEDVVVTNRSTVERTARLARQLGNVLLGVGILGVATFLWITVRQQQELEDQGFSGIAPVEDEVSWVDRVDAFTNPVIYLLFAAMVFSGGVVIRLLADGVVALTGGSLSGYEPGDTLDVDPDADPDVDQSEPDGAVPGPYG
jgi:hypothetical protein